MTEQEPSIVLYDLASTTGVCFSPVVWRIRLILNYKGIPYRTVFLEFPDIGPTLQPLVPPPPESKYTVPAIHHTPSGRYIMDSSAISEFLEAEYPDPPLTLHSPLGAEIEAKARASAKAHWVSITPREAAILSPRAEEFFRAPREEQLGHSLEKLLVKEEELWAAADGQLREVSDLIMTNKGPFLDGQGPTYSDFFLAGAMQSARVVHEPTFQRLMKYPGFESVYAACSPFMKKNT